MNSRPFSCAVFRAVGNTVEDQKTIPRPLDKMAAFVPTFWCISFALRTPASLNPTYLLEALYLNQLPKPVQHV